MGSRTLVADSAETMLRTYLSAVLLIGLVVTTGEVVPGGMVSG